MTLLVVLVAALGAGGGAALLLAWSASPSTGAIAGAGEPGSSAPQEPILASLRRRSYSWWLRTVLAPAAGGLVIGMVTGWPVAGVLAALGVAGFPALLGRTATSIAAEKVEAIATWTELLRDTLAASAGMTQAIVSTAPIAPSTIRSQVTSLAARLSSGVPATAALRTFAEELDDSTGDLVVCSLLLAASARAQRLVDLLSSLADSAREDVAMRLRVEAARASTRSGVRTIVVFSVVFAAGLALLAHDYLSPFGTATGQLVLVAVGACYALGLVLMVHLARPAQPVRMLGPSQPAGRLDRASGSRSGHRTGLGLAIAASRRPSAPAPAHRQGPPPA